ncbi:MAG: hypothetical protein NTU41_10565, partial [Chloroflexi bacterium]|nr:hypothetical protein [Chloroflexota bacterium]
KLVADMRQERIAANIASAGQLKLLEERLSTLEKEALDRLNIVETASFDHLCFHFYRQVAEQKWQACVEAVAKKRVETTS